MNWRRWPTEGLGRFLCTPPGGAHRARAFSIALFGLLTYDFVLLVPRAARYGSDGFHLPHLPSVFGLAPAPGRTAVLFIYLVLGYLAGRATFAVPSRRIAGAVAGLFGAVYFWSQLDSFQHHYFVLLILLWLAFFRFRDSTPPTWPLRLVLLQTSALYFWAAVAKLDPSWLDGSALALVVRDGAMLSVVQNTGGFATAAVLVLAAELFLAVAIHVRRLAWPAVVVGIGLHLGIEMSDMAIDRFSYYMMALYLLIAPPVPALDNAARSAATTLSNVWQRIPEWPLLAASAASTAVLWLLPFDVATYVAIFAAVALIAQAALDRSASLRPLATGHLGACLAVFTVVTLSTVPVDYYRFLGGAARRLDQPEVAMEAYKRATEVDPEFASGFVKRGDLVVASDPFQALVYYDKAIAANPDYATAHAAVARVYHGQGRGPEAMAAAKRALELGARDKRSRAIYNYWKKRL